MMMSTLLHDGMLMIPMMWVTPDHQAASAGAISSKGYAFPTLFLMKGRILGVPDMFGVHFLPKGFAF